MRHGLSILALVALLSVACLAQTSDTAQQSSSEQQNRPAAASQGTDQKSQSDQKGQDDKPSAMQRLKKRLHDQMSSGCVNAIGQHCWDNSQKDDQDKDASNSGQPQQSANAPLPHSDQDSDDNAGESSSRGTKLDLSPPPGEAPAPGVGGIGEVQELKPWDPHKADKNIEVGNYYFKQKNYRAAESRYAEALYWQDNSAVAMFRLAQAEEKLGKFSDALKNYEGYLKILPDGEFSAQAKQGADRMKTKPASQEKAEVIGHK